MSSSQHSHGDKGKDMSQVLGELRASKEVTEIGCLLMVVGLAEVIQPLTWICGLVNSVPTGTTVTEGLPFSTLIGYCFCAAIGVLTVLVGYAAALQNAGSSKLTTFVAIFVQTAYILTVSSCMTVTRIASEDGTFLRGTVMPAPPLEDEPNNKLLASMGVMLIVSYWFGMLGSISVLLGGLQNFQSGHGHQRDGTYYGARLFFYSFILFLGGAAQTVVGLHLEMTHDTQGGPISDDGSAFYKVAMLVVTYPSIAMAVGSLQMFNGLWGMLRKLGCLPKNDSGAFVSSIWFGWFVQLVLQIMVQTSVLPGPLAAREPPELAAFCFGINFMPAYLDSKSKSLPTSIEPTYYGENSTFAPAASAAPAESGVTDEQENCIPVLQNDDQEISRDNKDDEEDSPERSPEASEPLR